MAEVLEKTDSKAEVASRNHAAVRKALTGNEAIAYAMKQINPDVVAAYPITPATEIVQIYSSYVADGLVDTEFVAVESEHSAMSATIGASASGARAMTATSSQGLALMWEMLYIAAGLRLPIVMPVTNRALSAPINIHCDHSDTMGARDAGWIHIFSENSQEAYDNAIQAIRIVEDKRIRIPAMVTMDGFIISHAMEVVDTLEDDIVREFLGTYHIERSLLDVDNPITMGSLDFTDYYFEHRRSMVEPILKAHDVILEIAEEYAELSGRRYGLFEEYRMDDAELAIIVLGSTAGTAKLAIDNLRGQGVKAGMIKIRVFRPFPYGRIADAIADCKAVAVLDRSDGLSGLGGPVFGEVRNGICDREKKPITVDYVYGLGGRDINVEMIESVYEDLRKIAAGDKPRQLVSYLGVRE